MINLLPHSRKKEIRAAYSNTLLLRYLVLLLGALGFLAVALGITFFSLKMAGDQADATKAENEQRTTDYAKTRDAATQLRSDLSSAKELFESENRYSLMLIRLSSLLPDGSALDSLQVDNASFAQPLSIVVHIRNENAAKALQNNFTNSSYVTNVSLGNINTTENAQYPYSVELSFTFDRSILE